MKKEELNFVLGVQQGNIPFEEALKQYHNFIWQQINRYNIAGREDDDLYSILSMELYNAIQTYDPTKGVKFMSYLGKLFNSKLSLEISHSKRVKNGDETYYKASRLDRVTKESKGSEYEMTYGEMVLIGDYTYDDLSYRHLCNSVYEVLNELPDKYTTTFKMVVIDGMKQCDVAKQLGITQPGVRERIKWIRKHLYAKGIDGINYQY